MKGLIIIPRESENTYIPVGRYAELFMKIKEGLGFDITSYNDFAGLDSEYDVVVSFKNPQKSRFHDIDGILNLKPRVKLVSYLTDLHSHADIDGYFDKLYGSHDIPYEIAMRKVLERSDMVLSPYPAFFKKKWGKFMNKFVHFPHFVNHNSTRLWQPKDMRCILSGALEQHAYPFRNYVGRSRDQNIYTLPHPNYRAECYIRDDQYKVGTAYYKELSKFFCALATPSVLGYVVAKYMEIPACGCLLLAEYTEDLDNLGFQDGVNYLEVTKESFHEDLHYILDYPHAYDDVIKNGYDLIMNNYTIDCAVKRFRHAMEAL